MIIKQLINLGVKSYIDPELGKRILVSNMAALILIPIFLLLGVLAYTDSLAWVSYVCFSYTFVLFATLVLNGFEQNKTARIVYVLSRFFVVFVFSGLFHNNAQVSHYLTFAYFPALLVPFVVFKFSDKWVLIVIYTIGVGLVVCDFLNIGMISSGVTYVPPLLGHLFMFLFPVSAIFILIYGFYIIREIHFFENYLLASKVELQNALKIYSDLYKKLVINEKKLKKSQDISKISYCEYRFEDAKFVWSDNIHLLLNTSIQQSTMKINDLLEVIQPADLFCFKRWVLKLQKEQNVQSVKIHLAIKNKDNQHVCVRILGEPIYKGRKLNAIVSVIQDITDEELNRVELLAAKERAEIAVKAKSQFLSVMSHEIRTPMNAVVGLSNILYADENQQVQKDNISNLKFSADNLMALINDILDFNKLEENKIELEEIEFNLNQMCQQIHALQNYQVKKKSVELIFEYDENCPDLFIGDPVRLTQVLNNLLSNAIKFTDIGKVGTKIELVDDGKDSATLLFEIFDTGIGIPKDKQDLVFEMFTQADSHTTRKFGGTGLGLTICRKLVGLMGDTIKVRSEEGKGSTFYFEIQLKKQALQLATNTVNSVSTELSDFQGEKVLLVEDNIINITVAKQFLERWNLDVDVAENGQIALDKFPHKNYDLILLDIQMPVMDGYTVSKILREEGHDVPILAMTAASPDEVRAEVMECGMNGCLTKPFNPSELHRNIKSYLQTKV